MVSIQYDKKKYKGIFHSAIFAFFLISLIVFFIVRDSDWASLLLLLPALVVGSMVVCQVFYGWYRLSKANLPLILLEKDQITLYQENGKHKTILQSNIKEVSFDTADDGEMMFLVVYLYKDIMLTFGESIKNTVMRLFIPMDHIHRFVLTCTDTDVQVLKAYFQEKNIAEINENRKKQDFYVIGRIFYTFITSIITFLLVVATLPKTLNILAFGIVFCIWILDAIKNKSTFYQSELTRKCLIKVHLWAVMIGLYWSSISYIPGNFVQMEDGLNLSTPSVLIMCLILVVLFMIVMPKDNLYVSFWTKRYEKRGNLSGEKDKK